jgi:hypothetical protein
MTFGQQWKMLLPLKDKTVKALPPPRWKNVDLC